MTDTLVYDAAARLFADLSTPTVINAAEAGTWPAMLWNAVSAAGFLDALGGGDAAEPLDGLSDMVGILRAAGRHGAPLPLPETMLARFLARRAALAPPDGPLALLVEGPDARIELRSIGGRAFGKGSGGAPERLSKGGSPGGGWHLSVEASAVPWAREARAFVASIDSRVALVDRAAAAIEPALGMSGEPRDRVSLGATLDAAMVGEAPPGTDAALMVRLGALARAAQMAGALEEALRLAVIYANDRVQFGRPIGKLQAIQQQLALAAEQVAASAVAVAAAAEGARTGDLAFAAAAAKLRVGEAAGKVADIVHQVHGAIGFTHEHRLHHLTRRLWCWRDEFGTESAWALELGRLAAAQGADGLWPFLAER